MEFKLFKNQTRFKIALALIDKPEGLSIMELNELLDDVAQATLYRHVNAMHEDKLLKIVKTKKQRFGVENFYAIDSKGYKIDEVEWSNASYDDKVDFVSYYFMFVLQSYQSYLKSNGKNDDRTTFSITKLNLKDDEFENFQSDLNELISKYYNGRQSKDKKERMISLVIVP
ncbi:transcriptional regulator [Salinicoccus sp. YB14-2]|uniref:transcriptional regulator n=1 Tax=Salinicoccus sp. YB14-2 TaxID=1572701 RepID=UPI0006914FB3|nr:transcriptional regulator [Salinicoccus sp. YB14-2]